MINLSGFYEKNCLLLTITTFFLISLTIELAQAWIPFRSSQSLDLIFNTLGGYTGAMFYCLYQHVLNKLNMLSVS
jgi:glycopeptide antibiotics resistance protein